MHQLVDGFIIKQNFPLVGGRAVLNLIHNQSTEVFVSLLWTARSCTKTQATASRPNLSCTWKQYSVLCATRSTMTAPNVLTSQSFLCTFSGNVQHTILICLECNWGNPDWLKAAVTIMILKYFFNFMVGSYICFLTYKYWFLPVPAPFCKPMKINCLCSS